MSWSTVPHRRMRCRRSLRCGRSSRGCQVPVAIKARHRANRSWAWSSSASGIASLRTRAKSSANMAASAACSVLAMSSSNSSRARRVCTAFRSVCRRCRSPSNSLCRSKKMRVAFPSCSRRSVSLARRSDRSVCWSARNRTSCSSCAVWTCSDSRLAATRPASPCAATSAAVARRTCSAIFWTVISVSWRFWRASANLDVVSCASA